jgi:hypothetical protein
MHPQLAVIERDLHDGIARFRRLMDATPDERWAVRAEPAEWSVAECIVHLDLSAEAMLPLLVAATGEARALGGAPARRYRHSLFGWVLTKAVGPAPGVGRFRLGRVRTAARFEPPPTLPPRDAIERDFLRLHEGTMQALRTADGAPVDRVTVPSPFVEGARYDGYSAFRIVARHVHRHLAQGERVWAGR